MALRVVELFCGIGGAAAALDPGDRVVAAVDQSEPAARVYEHNHPQPVLGRNIVGLGTGDLPEADLWWMSPPCQPYTVRGRRRDLDDPRAKSLVRVVALVGAIRPPSIALENVPAFSASRARLLLRETLDRAGYRVAEAEICPTAMGIPNARRRFYLVASLERQPTLGPLPRMGHPLPHYLDPDPDPSLALDPALAERWGAALHAIDVHAPRKEVDDGPASEAIAECFTSGYARSPLFAGSVVRTERGLRRFSPEEILRLLHFPAAFAFPPGTAREIAWSLAGNSVSVAVVREVIRAARGAEGGPDGR